MRSIFVVIFLIITGLGFSQNQAVLVKGKVFDFQTKKSLSEVSVFINDSLAGYTDENGKFEFSCKSEKIQFTFIKTEYEIHSLYNLNKSSVKNEITVFLIPNINELNEVVISADKIEKKIAELSVSIDIIDQDEISNKHIGNVEEIVKQSQGVEINDGQMSIRGGTGFSYGAGSRVLALTDGLPINSADAGNIRWQFLPTENISKIEIIKGASSVLYGSSALNGIINFISAEPDSIPDLKFSISSGVYDKPVRKETVWWNTPRIYSDASLSFSKNFKQTKFSTTANFNSDNAYRQLNNEKLGKLNIKALRTSRKLAGFKYGLNILAGYNNKTDFILWENASTGALKQNEETATELNALFFTVDPYISYQGPKNFKHEIKIRLQYSDNQYPTNSANDSRSLSNFAEYQLYKKFFSKLNAVFGISNFVSQINSEFYGNHSGKNISAYSQLDYKFFKMLNLSVGVRTEYNTLDGAADRVVPVFRSGINFIPGKSTFIRASFGQGYRYPSIAEKYAYTTLGNVKILPNENIKPEYGWSSEIGIKQGIKLSKTYGQIDFSLFLSENKDMIEYVFGLFPDPTTHINEFGFKSENIENSRIYGAETEIMIKRRFKKLQLFITGGYTYIYPVEINSADNSLTEDFLKYRRNHSAKVNTVIKFKQFDFRADVFYKSKVLRIDNVFISPVTRERLLPGFYDYWTNNNNSHVIFDLYVSYNISNKIKLSAAVKNVGNTEYMDRPGNIMPHRFYSLQLSGKI